ncbi:MAG TPA: adenylate/guanylate cyclase domain-containing protein [Actinomycetota bacterium]|jgi:class 3 adenylate cyclase|nr:adenylate/guanylate cyclase domain-containing protein [Actinomycetota bacterium]
MSDTGALRDDYLPWAVDARDVPEDVRTVVLGSREGTERRRALGAVVFTDIVDSTMLMAELGNRRWRDLLEAHNALVRRELLRYGGSEVDTAGDGFVATFAGPSDAIACARAAIEAVRWIGLDLRAGVHAGEFELVAERPGRPKPSGLAMSIGARVCDLAEPSELLASDTVRQLLIGSDYQFEARGIHALKGVPGDWVLYAVDG